MLRMPLILSSWKSIPSAKNLAGRIQSVHMFSPKKSPCSSKSVDFLACKVRVHASSFDRRAWKGMESEGSLAEVFEGTVD